MLSLPVGTPYSVPQIFFWPSPLATMISCSSVAWSMAFQPILPLRGEWGIGGYGWRPKASKDPLAPAAYIALRKLTGLIGSVGFWARSPCGARPAVMTVAPGSPAWMAG